jgi:ankyrin repeat protein
VNTLDYLLDSPSTDVHVRSNNGFQAIHYAALHGHAELIKRLLSIDRRTVNSQTKSLFTPAYLACQHGDIEPIELLASHEADFQLRDEYGSSCLHTGTSSCDGRVRVCDSRCAVVSLLQLVTMDI